MDVAVAMSTKAIMMKYDLYMPLACVVATIWLWGCVAGHVRDIIQNRNFAPGSAGFVFYWGLLPPMALIALLSVSKVG